MNSLSKIRDYLSRSVSPVEFSLLNTRLTLALGFGVKSFPATLDHDQAAVAKVKSALTGMGVKIF